MINLIVQGKISISIIFSLISTDMQPAPAHFKQHVTCLEHMGLRIVDAALAGRICSASYAVKQMDSTDELAGTHHIVSNDGLFSPKMV